MRRKSGERVSFPRFDASTGETSEVNEISLLLTFWLRGPGDPRLRHPWNKLIQIEVNMCFQKKYIIIVSRCGPQG